MLLDDGVEGRFDVAADAAVLDAGLAAGFDLPFGCRVGACGACAVRVLEGAEHAVEPDELEADTLDRCDLAGRCRLACRLRVRGPVILQPEA